MPRKYTVELDADAQEQFDSLGEKQQRQIRNKVLALEDNPRPKGARKIYDHEGGSGQAWACGASDKNFFYV